MNKELQIDLEKAIHFDPEKIKKMYGGDYKKVAKDLAIENTKLHIINSSKEQEIKRLNNIIDKAIEFITSHESIEIMQQTEHNENNKGLDEKTIIEMTRRYIIAHNKILDILKEK